MNLFHIVKVIIVIKSKWRLFLKNLIDKLNQTLEFIKQSILNHQEYVTPTFNIYHLTKILILKSIEGKLFWML